MTRHLITMGGSAYDDMIGQTVRDAPHMGADEVWVFDDVFIESHEFRSLNAWLWDHFTPGVPNAPKGRGFGWYSWKPFLLIYMLDHMQDGDIVLYLDGDSRPVADFSNLYDVCHQEGGAMFFAADGHPHHYWTKRDCQLVMGQNGAEGNSDEWVQAGVARFCLIEKGPWKPRQFLYEWLTYSTNRLATTFDPSVLGPECHDFKEHRTEQAIMTNLCMKYNYPLHREADGSGNDHFHKHPGDKYPQMFEQRHMGGPYPLGPGSRFRRVP